MDVIIKGIFASEHPLDMKHTVLKRIVENCPSQGANVNKRVFQFCCVAKLDTSPVRSQTKLADYLLNGWATTNIGDAWLFLLNELLPDKDGNFSKVDDSDKPCAGRVHLVYEFLRILRTRDESRIAQTAPSISWKLSLMYTKCDELHTLVKIVDIFNTFPDYLTQNKHVPELVAATVGFLSKLSFSAKEKQELVKTLSNVAVLSEFIAKIIANNKELLCILMNQVFSHIYDDNNNPSSCVASLLACFPTAIIDNVAKRVIKDGALTDEKMTEVVGRMVEWISWPGVKNLGEWVIRFLQALYHEKRFGVICNIIEEKTSKIFGYLEFPMVRDHAITIVSYLLLAYQHDPQVFHKVSPMAVTLLRSLEKEDTPSSLSIHQGLVELMFTLMYQFPGFPDVYSDLILVLKGHDRPPESKMKTWLSTSRLVGLDVDSASLSACPIRAYKSDTGKVGLVNLGNTCYMNSMIQALFMLKRFRYRILRTKFSPVEQPVSFHLQKLFGLLMLSERPAISPTQFSQVSIPSWFSPGSQQDCSEFLKHLLDRLDCEDSSTAPGDVAGCQSSVATVTAVDKTTQNPPSELTVGKEESAIHSLFCGEAAVCTRCSTCKSISCKKEAFNDISLAFPDTTVDVVANGFLLKGGNLSCDAYGTTEEGKINTSSTVEHLANGASLEALHSAEKPHITSSEAAVKTGKSSLAGVQHSPQPLLSVQALLQLALGKEVLSMSNQYHCDACGSLQDAERKMTIVSAPQYLVLTLKRFTYDAKSHTRSKVLQNLHYPATINVNVYPRSVADNSAEMEHIFQCTDSHTTTVTMGSDSEDSQAPSLEMRRETFDLCSIVVHSGISSDCGHYYSYCSERDAAPSSMRVCSDASLERAGSPADGDNSDDHETRKKQALQSEDAWYMLNDCRVTITDRQSIARVSENFPRDTPYMLIYKKSTLDVDSEEADCPPVLADLIAMVDADNKRYLQDLKDQAARQNRLHPHASNNDRFDKDGPAGGCGGPSGSSAGGMDLNGSRFIY